MRVLTAVVEIAALAVLDPGQDLPLGGSVAAQFVRHDHTGNVLQALQQLLEEALGCLRVAPTLHQDVEHGAVLVDRALQIVQFATEADEYLILSAKSGGLGKSGEGGHPCLGAW